jgi:hypothetical protein
MIVSVILAGALLAGPTAATPTDSAAQFRGRRITDPTELATFTAKHFVPSFARQLRLSCSVCHVGFPELTWFGRMFKLNGYSLSGLQKIVDQVAPSERQTLSLTPIPAMSMSALVSSTSVAKALPGTPATRSEYPQQLSIFWAGQVSSSVGALLQLTYSDVTGRVAMDVSDIRYARHLKLEDKDLLLGVTLHNTPTAQDPWNTLPAYGFPFTAAALAPRPSARTLVDGPLASQVLGLGVYGLWNQLVYAEVTSYSSAPQGPRALVDSAATNTLSSAAPYWRLALQHNVGGTYAMVGAFGFSARQFTRGTTGPADHFNDLGVDAQLEHPVGRAQLIGRASWIHEDQTLPALYASTVRGAQHPTNSLSTMRVNATLAVPGGVAVSLGAFSTGGTSDALLYAPGAVNGSAAGRPDTKGQVAEVVLNHWLNSRVGVQYVRYDQFNGRASSYDVPTGGRNAADNNTLYLYLWLAF